MMVEAICDLREQERADVRTTAPPNGSCCRRALVSLWVERSWSVLYDRVYRTVLVESLAAELGR